MNRLAKLVEKESKMTTKSLEEGGVHIQGDKRDLRGVAAIGVRCEIRGMNLYLKGDGVPPVTTKDVTLTVSQQFGKAGLAVQADAPTLLIVECDTPPATLMTYVNFIVTKRVASPSDPVVERLIPVWIGTGYERRQVHPEPVGRLTRAFLTQWAEANGKSVDVPPEEVPSVVTVILLPNKKFSFNGMEHPHEQLIDVLKALTTAERELVMLQSGWQTREDAGGVFETLINAGFKAKIDFKLGGGGPEENSFMEEWKKASGGKPD